ncbi:hypothetical protein D3C86_1080280 [compost metagenome]
MKPQELPEIGYVILSGSVLKSNFDWSSLLDSGKVGTVVNDCGVNDNILLLSQIGVLFTGMAGRVGFYGFTHARLVNRFFPGGHSHYFEPLDHDPDAFMRRQWVPLLLNESRAEPLDERPQLSAFVGAAYALMRFSDPIKLFVYLGLGGLVVFESAIVPRQQLVIEQAQRQYTEARTLLASELGISDAIGTMVSLSENREISGTEISKSAALLARYGMQRVSSPELTLSDLPKGAVFRWNGNTYLRADHPVRIDINPLAAVLISEENASILLREVIKANRRHTEILIVDATTGATRSVFSDEAGDRRLKGPFTVLRTPDQPHRILLSFQLADIEDDKTRTRWWALDLRSGTGRVLPFDSAKSLANCKGLIPLHRDDDESDRSPGVMKVLKYASLFGASDPHSESSASVGDIEGSSALGSEADRCTRTVALLPIRTLLFPKIVSEEALYSRTPEPKITAISTEGASCGSPERSDNSALGDIRIENHNGEPDPIPTPLEEGYCRHVLLGPSGAKYIAGKRALGQWLGGWTICDLATPQTATRCGDIPFPSEEGGGQLWHEPRSPWVAVGLGRTATFSDAFVVTRLADRKSLHPDKSPDGTPTDIIVYDQRKLVIVTASVPGSPLSSELLIYRIETEKLSLIARRRFDSTDPPDAEAPDTTPASRLYRVSDLVVVSLPGESLLAINVMEEPAKWTSRFLHPRDKQDPINVQWTIRSVGLGTRDVAALWPSPDGQVAAISAGASLRLVLLRDGTLFGPPINLGTPALGCAQPIRTISFDAIGSVNVATDTCGATRRAPPTSVTSAEYLHISRPSRLEDRSSQAR